MIRHDPDELLEVFWNEAKEVNGPAVVRFFAENEKGFRLILKIWPHDGRVRIELQHRELKSRLVVVSYEEVVRITVFREGKRDEGFVVWMKDEEVPVCLVTLRPYIQIKIPAVD
jgi:hypothetical protein